MNHPIGEMTICTVGTRSSGTITISAVTTAVPELVITPAIVATEAGAARIDGGEMQLTHAHTGRSVMRGSYNDLQDLAGKLAEIPWTFTDPEHFKQPANSEVLRRIQAIIREWMTADNDGGPIRLMSEDEDAAAARGAAPSQTLLREQLDWWLKHAKSIHDRNLYEDNKALWYESISTEVQGFGVIYLIAVLRQIDPAVADIASRHLYASWDSGEIGEWVYEWSEQLAAGKPLSIYAIPTTGAMAEFVGADDIVELAQAALEGTTPAPWTHHISDGEAGETHAEYQANTLMNSGEPLHVVTAASPDPKFAYIVPAIAGDGPTSNRNAEFIAAARTLMPALINEIKRLRGVTR